MTYNINVTVVTPDADAFRRAMKSLARPHPKEAVLPLSRGRFVRVAPNDTALEFHSLEELDKLNKKHPHPIRKFIKKILNYFLTC